MEEAEISEGRGRSYSLRKLVRRRKKKENIPKVSFAELLKLNKPDWLLVLVGVIGSAVLGVLFPLLAILFSNVLAVSPCSVVLLCAVHVTCLIYKHHSLKLVRDP